MKEDTIKQFLTKMSEQDNRSTAAPYFYVIRTSKKVPAYSGCGEFIEYYDPEDPEEIYDSIEEYITKQKEYQEYEEMLDVEKEDFDLKMEDIEYELEKVELNHEWEEKGMFLTETDAKEHLRRNYYHYSKDAHTYVKHSWRAPELEEFLKALFEHFEVPKGNLDL